MKRILGLVLAVPLFMLGCSSSDGAGNDGGSAGSGGSAGIGGNAGTGGSGGSAGSAGSAGSSGSAGSAGAAALSCPDSTNPVFGSCVEAFLAGCYTPDTSGTCTNQSDTVTWSDGYKYVRSGSGAGMYSPGTTTPCITLVTQGGNFTATKGSETLTYVADTDAGTGTITCPDGSTFAAGFDQVSAFNTCKGIDCGS